MENQKSVPLPPFKSDHAVRPGTFEGKTQESERRRKEGRKLAAPKSYFFEFIPMEVLRLQFVIAMAVALVFSLLLPSTTAQASAPAPPPSSDGVAIDQGIAYLLMLVALALTYMIH